MGKDLDGVIEEKEEQFFRMKLCVKMMEKIGEDGFEIKKEHETQLNAEKARH